MIKVFRLMRLIRTPKGECRRRPGAFLLDVNDQYGKNGNVSTKTNLRGVRMNKNPDLRIDGEYWEVEAPEWPYKRTNIDNRIIKGQEQGTLIK
jgi:hypothetical protein